MRAVSRILLVVLLLLQAAGTHLLFQLQPHAIRKQIKGTIKRGVPENELSYFNVFVKKKILQISTFLVALI